MSTQEKPATDTPKQWISRLVLDTQLGNFLGDTRIRLLEKIQKHGSISQAAKSVPMSYKSAWDAIDIMNNLAEAPVVTTSTGGRNGGGTQVTAYGKKLISLYRAIEREYQQSVARLVSAIPSLDEPDVPQLQHLLKSMSVHYSARNQFLGRVMSMRADDVDFEVGINIDTGEELIAVITAESAERLGIKLGNPIQALIKSTAVIIASGAIINSTARNIFTGKIIRIHYGAVHAEVVMALANNKTLTSVVTRESVEEMGLQEGEQVSAMFQASSVILANYR